MSTSLATIEKTGTDNDDLDFTEFFGGVDKGKCIQLTQGLGFSQDRPGYIQLSTQEALDTAYLLIKWAKKVEIYRAQQIQSTEGEEFDKALEAAYRLHTIKEVLA